MKLPFVLIAGALFYSLLVFPVTAVEPSAKPNIVYIMADELGYFEPGFNGGTTWRAVQNKPKAKWELYDLATDPSESKDLAAAKPKIVAKLEALATAAHTPAVEGTFASTDRHERDRRAKTGQHDNPAAPDPLKKAKPNANASVMPTKGMLSNKDWKIVRVSSENVGNEKFARNAIDGDPATLWHTRFTGTAARPPYELVIDLGAQQTVRGFVYLARQDEGWNGAIKEVEFCMTSLTMSPYRKSLCSLVI
jgi:F5/8 type C domain